MSDAAAPSPLPTVRDFPDRLPAMLVKELRQGLRARLFAESVAGFHLLIMVLILPVVMSPPGESRGVHHLVWWIIATVLLLLLPLRGLSAMTQERRGRTLDTLLLTNLQAGRIVWGKWLAIAAQTVMVAVSVLPYLLMLYHSGGVSLPGTILTLLHLTLAGLVLTAAFIALSWNDAWLHRVAPALCLAWLAISQWAAPALAGVLRSGPQMTSTGRRIPEFLDRMGLPGAILAAAGLVFVLLENTAQRLAPGVESHQARSRMAGLGFAALAAAGENPLLFMAALAALTLVSLTSLTEPWPLQLSPERAWHRWPGLAPGWPHGVLWALAAWSLTVVFTGGMDSPALPLAAWLACGFLLLWPGPASWKNRPWLLAATALLFMGGQALLRLAAEMLNHPGLESWAGLLPSPMAFAGVVPHPGLPWLAAAAAAGCLTAALTALHRNRSRRRGGPA
jgi:ABC-type transport system involved in cytochrome c biogenesis permease component